MVMGRRAASATPDAPGCFAPQNLMFDRRVCRGSTFRHAMAPPAVVASKPSRRAKTRAEGRRGSADFKQDDSHRGLTPEPVPGRVHALAQTKSYLEVLDEGIGECEQAIQTDEIIDAPLPPLFYPRPSGESKSTEIGPGDLFDFDAEVAPTIEVLVGKTIDQALMDVVEEAEISQVAAQQEQFEHMRMVKLAEMQRLEARETRLQEEKQRRLRQARERKEKEVELARKVAARTVAKDSLHAMNVAVLGNLASKGLFRDGLRDQIEEEFLPWLQNESASRVEVVNASKKISESVTLEAMAQITERVRQEADQRRSLLADLQQEHELQLMAQRQAAAELTEAAAAAAGNAAAPPPNNSDLAAEETE